jgi:stage II sporulation protein AA (anti-sigma F factor antagonist)
MESKYYNEEKLLVLKLTEEIDECSVQKIRRKADYEIERHIPKKVIFDFNSVSFMDSAGIGLIIGRYRIANMLGGVVEIANVAESIKRILELSGILKIIPIIELEEKVG